MKTYLNFQLSGRQMFPLWIIFYILFIAPYFLLVYEIEVYTHQDIPQALPVWTFPLVIWLILFALIWVLYFAKIIIEGVCLNETRMKCNYKPGKYLGIIFFGIFLVVVTAGIYLPWFIRNVQRYFVNNSSYRGHNFSFHGNGGRLFLIITLLIVLPVIVITLFMIKMFGIDIHHESMNFRIINQVIMSVVLIPYIYFIYKWLFDISYKEYHIKWNTKFLPSTGKIALEMILTIITLGIYFPLAGVRLYKYFSERTRSNLVENNSIQFGYDLKQLNDFLFIWGQVLLTIITLGIYYPWAFCKIAKRMLGKTYLTLCQI